MRIGLLGGGQLGRMLALAGYPLGLRFRTLDHSPESPAGDVTELVAAEFTDLAALERFASGLELVTYEFENVPIESVRFLERRLPVYPPIRALEVGQDRLSEKIFFQREGIPTASFVKVDSVAELEQGLVRTGFPAVLKTRNFGYDGKGQAIVESHAAAKQAWQRLSAVPLLLEQFVAFEREVSVLAARSRDGETSFYPLVENEHRAGILRLSKAPAPRVSTQLQDRAEEYAARVLEALDYAGVMAIEFFELDGALLANEMAPRVHNSGHWTIEGAETSQFENHLRAVLGLPLGSVRPIGHSAMINLIGELPDLSPILELPGAHLHLYGKKARPNRKLGHVTLRAADREALESSIAELRALIG